MLSRTRLDDHLVRLELGSPGLAAFESTGIPDEWVGLVVPGQFQSRYYTVRAWDDERMTLDVVIHDSGLVTEWAAGDPVGDTVTIQPPQGSFSPPDDVAWVYLVGDLTALPAMARITESLPDHVLRHVWAEASAPVAGYFAAALEGQGDLTWTEPPASGSALAALVESLAWPEGPGYFWMAGESGQMRAIRRHLMRDLPEAGFGHDVMGYWRISSGRQPRAVDPGPAYRAGKAAGKSDAEIWADYDAQGD